jgi:hypothetical protein
VNKNSFLIFAVCISLQVRLRNHRTEETDKEQERQRGGQEMINSLTDYSTVTYLFLPLTDSASFLFHGI